MAKLDKQNVAKERGWEDWRKKRARREYRREGETTYALEQVQDKASEREAGLGTQL